MSAAETITKLEAMRDEVRELLKQAPATVNVEGAIGTLTRAVDALTYVVIDQLREGATPSRCLISHEIILSGVTLGGGATLIIDGNPHLLESGETITISDSYSVVGL